MGSWEDDSKARLAETEAVAQTFIGLTRVEAERRAQEIGRPLRIIRPGDAITLDLRYERVNVYVEGDVVVRADAG